MGLGAVHSQPTNRIETAPVDRYKRALEKIAFNSMNKTQLELCEIACAALFDEYVEKQPSSSSQPDFDRIMNT